MHETTVIIPSSPADKAEIKQYLDTASDCLTRISLERESIKDIIAEVAEKFDLDKKYVRKMVNIHYKSNLNDINAEHEDVVALYTGILGIDVE